MAMKKYLWNGTVWLFDEDDVPDGALPMPPVMRKARRANNKVRRVADKAVKPIDKEA